MMGNGVMNWASIAQGCRGDTINMMVFDLVRRQIDLNTVQESMLKRVSNAWQAYLSAEYVPCNETEQVLK